MVVDGTSLWHFLNSWSEIFKAEGRTSVISRPPIHDHRLFSQGRYIPFSSLPLIDDQHGQVIISRDEADKAPEAMIRERIFHFSSESVAMLKAKANVECNTTEISSSQALSAHLRRCITRARNFWSDQKTIFCIVRNARSWSVPPKSHDCFYDYLQAVTKKADSGELLEWSLWWAAWLLHHAVINQTSASHERIESLVQSGELPRDARNPVARAVKGRGLDSDPIIFIGYELWNNSIIRSQTWTRTRLL